MELQNRQFESYILNGSESIRDTAKILPDRVRHLNKSVDMSNMLSRKDANKELDPTVVKVQK